MQRRPRARSKLHWDDVRLFLALSRSRTVGAAGRSLGVNASTVSRRLAVLEEALGATLFDRSRDGIAATKAAEDLLPVAEQMEASMLRFEHAADGLEREVSGLVRITCPPDVADVEVVPLLPELRERHPRLQIELQPSASLFDLTRREADLALRTVRPTRGELIVTRLRTLHWQLAAAPALARKLGTLRNWQDAPFITWGERRSQIAPARWLRARLPNVEPVLRSDSLLLQLSAARAGIGALLAPEPSLAHYGLTALKLSPSLREAAGEWPGDELFLVGHRALREVPRVRAVWNLLVERVAR